MANPVLTRAFAREEQTFGPAGVEIPHVSVGTEKMTMDGVVSRTLALFGVLLAAAALTWTSGMVILALPAMFVALGLGLWATFSKKVRPAVMFGYAAAEGVFLSGLTIVFDMIYPGIGVQAVLATTATAGVMFVAYRSRAIRVTPKFRQMMMFALLGYLAFSVVSLVIGMFTGTSLFYSQFGWIAALIGVGLSAFTLVLDFADIEEGIGVGLPAQEEWRAAFGLMVSLVWMYTEILRLIAILRGND